MNKVQYQTKSGRLNWRPVFDKESEHELLDGMMGFCLACGHEQHGCEPDARKYQCEQCSCFTVYGLEELVLMGLLR